MRLGRKKKGNTALEAAFVEAGNLDVFQSLICFGGGAAYFTKELRRELLRREPEADLKYSSEGTEGFNKIKKFLTDGDLPSNNTNNNIEDEDAIVRNIVSVCCSRKYGHDKEPTEPIITAEEFDAFRKWQEDLLKLFDDEKDQRIQIALGSELERLELQETISRFTIIVKEETLQFADFIRMKFAIRLLIEKEANARNQIIIEMNNNNIDEIEFRESISRFNIFVREEHREFAQIMKLETVGKQAAILEAERRHRSKVLKLSGLSFVLGYAACWGYQRFVDSSSYNISHGGNFVVGSLLFAGTHKLFN